MSYWMAHLLKFELEAHMVSIHDVVRSNVLPKKWDFFVEKMVIFGKRYLRYYLELA